MDTMVIRSKAVDTYYGPMHIVEWECTEASCTSDEDCQCDPDLAGPDDDDPRHNYWA